MLGWVGSRQPRVGANLYKTNMTSSCSPLNCGLRPAGDKSTSVKNGCQESAKGGITQEQRKKRRIIGVYGYLKNQLAWQRGETCFCHSVVLMGLVLR